LRTNFLAPLPWKKILMASIYGIAATVTLSDSECTSVWVRTLKLKEEEGRRRRGIKEEEKYKIKLEKVEEITKRRREKKRIIM
jgi:hypothetical protein